MIKFCSGDILTETASIAIPINLVGSLGAGLAKQARDRFPRLRKAYENALELEILDLGHPVVCEDGQFILFPTKKDWRNPSNIEWIDKGCEFLSRNVGVSPPSVDSVRHGDYSTITTIALPRLGCGLGGLVWADVLTTFQIWFGKSRFEVRVYGEEVETTGIWKPVTDLPPLPGNTV